ncbi:MAG: bifunctional phosphopantothenoylcysteine decarboxylase/phosphopantothenate--cysteine ligase CoaBC [Thermoanaerobaculia bacterium]
MKIVLGVSGGIAAYKAPDLVRRLRERGAEVQVILTPNAARFVSALSLAAVSGRGVIVDQWGDASKGGVDHIEIARWADLLLIAPATANILAKMACGIADDALTTYALAHRGAIAVAPAMNTFMLAHPTVAENIAKLRARGVHVIEPVDGLLACGEEGAGKMPDPPQIAAEVESLLGIRDFAGRRVLVTAGPTREALDPVRYISNRSSGKMGYAIAEAASRRGASVTLIAGPTSLPAPSNVELVRVTSADEMLRAVLDRCDSAQILVKAAAVADFQPVDVASSKIKKSAGGDTITVTMKKTPDILKTVGARDPRPFIVAFAAETDAVEKHAQEKLFDKNADLIVANDVSNAAIGFDADENEVVVLARDGGRTAIAKSSKGEVANRLLDILARTLGYAASSPERRD